MCNRFVADRKRRRQANTVRNLPGHQLSAKVKLEDGGRPTEAPMPRFGRYLLVRELGSGGSGPSMAELGELAEHTPLALAGSFGCCQSVTSSTDEALAPGMVPKMGDSQGRARLKLL
jgi:hypothetical protein